MNQKKNTENDSEAILEQIKNLSLGYNMKVTPRRKIQIEKKTNANAFQILMTNQRNSLNLSTISSSALNQGALESIRNNEIEEEKVPTSESEHKEEPKRYIKERAGSYKKYTTEKKRELIKQAASSNRNPNSVGKYNGVGPTNIKRWQKEFQQKNADFGKDLRKEKSGRQVKHPDLDKHLLDWFTKLRQARVAVSGIMVLSEAESYVNLKKIDDLNLSNGWIWKLLRRLDIVKRKATKVAQKSADQFENEIKKFVSLITELR